MKNKARYRLVSVDKWDRSQITTLMSGEYSLMFSRFNMFNKYMKHFKSCPRTKRQRALFQSIEKKLFKELHGQFHDKWLFDLMYDYYMFGENYGADNPGWAHEGVDINYTGTNGRVVYAPISGHVHYINSSTIVIHPPTGSGSYSVNVQHLDNPIADGSNVTKGVTFIGNEGQGAGENHIHVGVCTHNGSNCTTIHSQKDLTLSCVAPYTYLD